MTYIEELQSIIHKLHGVHSTHVQSVPVKEEFRGQTVWDGIVEVFELHGHPRRLTPTLGTTKRTIQTSPSAA